jgi:hypothetical protein
MLKRRLSRSIAVAVIAAGALGASSVAALADNSPPSQVLSNFENHFAANIVRDCGFSLPLPSNSRDSLWLFCDTVVYGFNSSGKWALSDFIPGSTAAVGPSTRGKVPTDLSEMKMPGTGVPAMPNHDGPAQFLPTPALVTSAGLPCDSANDAYAVSWISGVTQDPAKRSDVLISFNDYCVLGSLDYLAEGSGLAQYDPASNTLTSEVTVFSSKSGKALSQQDLLGSPVVSGGYLYLFGSHCAEEFDAACIAHSGDAVYLARVPDRRSAWDKAGSYRWRTGSSGWTARIAAATSVLAGARPFAVNVSNFSAIGQKLVLIEQTDAVGAFSVFEATRPAGPWVRKTSGTVPCTTEGDSFCRAIIGHPELSTKSRLLVSYFNPGAAPYYYPKAGPEGHVMVAAFKW